MKRLVYTLLLVHSFSGLLAEYDWTYVDTQAMTTFLKQFIRTNDLVFDVGANIGNKTKLYLACGASKVICFEPQPECVNALKNTFRYNSRVVIEQKGLAAQNGFLTLFQCREANTISTFSQEWINHGRFSETHTWDKAIQVKVTTLDAMIKKYGIPHFCKIDVEGFEYEVLRGLSYPIPYLSFEFAVESLEQTKQCIAYLKSLGYTKFNLAIAERDTWLFEDWQSADTFTENLTQAIQAVDWNARGIGLLWGDIYACYA